MIFTLDKLYSVPCSLTNRLNSRMFVNYGHQLNQMRHSTYSPHFLYFTSNYRDKKQV